MPEQATDFVEVFLIISVVALGGGIALGVAIEALRQWSDNRRIRKHLGS